MGACLHNTLTVAGNLNMRRKHDTVVQRSDFKEHKWDRILGLRVALSTLVTFLDK